MSVDAYYTPTSLGLAILRAFRPYLPSAPARCWEPCAGSGNLVAAMRIAYPETHITATDISDKDDRGLADKRGKVDCREWRPASADLVFTNPPFSAGNSAAYELTFSVCQTLVEFADVQRSPLLIIAPASWYLGAERWAWLRHGSHACSTVAAIIKRPWKGQREVAVYAWGLRGAPSVLPDIRWNNDGSAPDLTCGGSA